MTDDVTFGSRQLSPDESVDQVAEYRPMSLRALVCFLLGLLSFFAFVHYLLWVLPILTFVVSLLTIRYLKRSEIRFTGSWLAYSAVLLSAVPLVGAPVDAVVWRAMVTRQSHNLAEEWLRLLIAGEQKRAHYWTLAVSARPKSEASYVRYYKDPTYLDQVEQYFNRDPQSRFVGRSEYQAEWLGATGVAGGIRSCRVSHNFLMRHSDGTTIPIIVDVRRDILDGDNSIHWEIMSVRDAEPARHQHRH